MALGGSAPRRYAESLLDLAGDAVNTRRYRTSLEALATSLDGAPTRALRDQSVPLEQRLEAVRAATAGEPGDIGGLAQLLVRRDRLALLPAIARAFGDLVDQRDGIVRARVTTAVALDERERGDLVGRLEAASRHRIDATFHVDPELIGGARVQVGDRLIDSSVRGQLEALRARLANG